VSSRGTSDEAALSVLNQINQTQNLIQSLLKEMRDGSAEQASLKAELKQLRHSVLILSNIIRGGDGHSKPLLSEVEVLKHSDLHLDKRISTVSDVLDSEIDEVANALSKQMDELRRQHEVSIRSLEEKVEAYKKEKDAQAVVAMQLQHDERKDLRLNKRQLFQVWSTIIIAVIAFISSAISLFRE